ISMLGCSCGRDLDGALQKGAVRDSYLSCQKDSDCREVTRTIRCCSGCGSPVSERFAINSRGFAERQKRVEARCSGKTCPHYICPESRDCRRTRAICKNHVCGVLVYQKKGCVSAAPKHP
ncbi:hypothetical protein KKF84_11845, partial [Myxococcota bacterium]|nr:hypothetical protein [Myxococcota bacterium]